MIPLTLKIKGIFSYQEEAIIDFTQLAQANIFGIFGKVGSGKSTILEAIMFALYGEVARMNTSGRSYNMMNLRSNEMIIDFTFEVGGVMYRARVDAKRKKKNFEQVDTPEFRYFSWKNDAWQPYDGFKASTILGIEAQHFKKTIIIPQNEFQKFLELSPTERTRMIKDIFLNLEKFELEENAKKLEVINNNKLLTIKNQMDEIGDITPLLIEENQLQLFDIQTLRNANEDKLKTYQTEEKQLQELKLKFEELEKLKNEADKLAHTEGSILLLQKQISDYEYFLQYLKTPLEQQSALQKNLEKNTRELLETHSQLTENERVTTQLQSQLEQLTPHYRDRETLLKKRDEVAYLIKIHALQVKDKDDTERFETGQKHLKEKEEARQKILDLKAPFQYERENLLKNQPDLQQLTGVNNWFLVANVLKRDVSDYEKKVNDIAATLSALDDNRRQKTQLLFAKFGVSMPFNVSINEIILKVKSLIKELAVEKERYENDLIHLRATEQLETLSNALSDGSPCPLCGATHHPNIWNADDVQKQIEVSQKQLDKLRNDVSTLQNIENELITLFQGFNNQKNQESEWVKKLETKKQEVQNHAAQFVWTAFDQDDFEAFQWVFDEAVLFGEKIKKVQQQIDDLEKTLATSDEYIEKCKVRLSTLKTQLDKNETSGEHLRSNIKILNEVFWLEAKTEFLENQAQLFENQYNKITQDYEKCESRLKILHEKSQLLRGGVAEKERANKTLSEETEKLSKQIGGQIEVSPFEDMQAIEKFSMQVFDLIKARQTVEDFKRQKAEIGGQINNLLVQLKDKTYALEHHETLRTDIQQLMDLINVHISEIAVLEAHIKNLVEKLERRSMLEKERLKLEARGKNLELLRSMFARSGFVNYVSTQYLINLCQAANERFDRFTRGQLRLKVSDTNDFEIKDMYNFGKTRHIRTLSGGQIFQASLALALALADSIQALSKTEQNFFFLDEGFGSLDRDSMQEVFNTLKSLRKENRIVGVISHVEEMQQEIDRYLKVTLDAEKGSQVEII